MNWWRISPPTASNLRFGVGTGTSGEMEQFTKWLKTHPPDAAQRIIGCLARMLVGGDNKSSGSQNLWVNGNGCHSCA